MVEQIETLIRQVDSVSIGEAAAALRDGHLVSFPTETVYGLGADARSPSAVAKIYAAKERPRFNPLISHVATAEAAFAQGEFDRQARRLAEAFWPGPLTLVVPASRTCSVCDLARAGLPTLALRVPAHPIARALLAEVAIPIAAPSANRSGRISPTEARHVAAELGNRCALILDGGRADIGVESTVVSCLDGTLRLLRPGGVSRAQIEALLEVPLEGRTERLLAPGMLASHYAPNAALRLGAATASPGEAVLDFGGRLRPSAGGAYLDLSPDGRLAEAAANLFAFLRRLDSAGETVIAVAPIPTHGLGEAINDRLSRAAAPRESNPRG